MYLHSLRMSVRLFGCPESLSVHYCKQPHFQIGVSWWRPSGWSARRVCFSPPCSTYRSASGARPPPDTSWRAWWASWRRCEPSPSCTATGRRLSTWTGRASSRSRPCSMRLHPDRGEGAGKPEDESVFDDSGELMRWLSFLLMYICVSVCAFGFIAVHVYSGTHKKSTATLLLITVW